MPIAPLVPLAEMNVYTWLSLPYVIVMVSVFSFLTIAAIADAAGKAWRKASIRRSELEAIVDLAQMGYTAEEVERLLERRTKADDV